MNYFKRHHKSLFNYYLTCKVRDRRYAYYNLAGDFPLLAMWIPHSDNQNEQQIKEKRLHHKYHFPVHIIKRKFYRDDMDALKPCTSKHIMPAFNLDITLADIPPNNGILENINSHNVLYLVTELLAPRDPDEDVFYYH
jgi:hypothetical protein